MPGDNSPPMAQKSAWWRKRAGFVDYHVWVTPNYEAESYAAGDYPNQSRGGGGLLDWTELDRPIENTDVVFWYSFGHTHIPRPEDYPVMPAAYIGFMLKPNGFFAMNPANDVPSSQPKTKEANGSCCH
jgi:primary-amine oxidase